MKLVTALVAVCLVASRSSANTSTFTPFDGGSSGSWHVLANWSNGVPTGLTRAIIQSGKTCEILDSNAVADTIVIEFGAAIVVRPGRSLTLENNTNNVPDGPTIVPDDSIIDGSLTLDRSPTLGGSDLIFSPASHVIEGSEDHPDDGEIVGVSSDCRIRVAAGKTLTNRLGVQLTGTFQNVLGIVGSLTITSASPAGSATPTFRNEGGVTARGHSLILDSSINLQDVAGANWSILCVSTLHFMRESLNLQGDVVMPASGEIPSAGGGELVVDQTVRTCGTFRRLSCSKVTVATTSPTTTFEYAYYVGGLACMENPATSGTGTCEDPFVISSIGTVTACTGE